MGVTTNEIAFWPATRDLINVEAGGSGVRPDATPGDLTTRLSRSHLALGEIIVTMLPGEREEGRVFTICDRRSPLAWHVLIVLGIATPSHLDGELGEG